MQAVLDAARSAWLWLRPRLKWIGLALIVLAFLSMALGWHDGAVAEFLIAACSFGLFKRRRHVLTDASGEDAKHIADAIRPGMQRRAEQALKEAEEHKRFAEQRIEQASADRERISKMSPEDVLRESQAYTERVRKQRKKGTGGALFVLLAGLAAPALSRAQDLSHPFMLNHPTSGEQGWYVPDDVWRAALADAQMLPELQAALDELRASVALHLAASMELRKQVEFEQALADEAWKSARIANLRVKRANRWYRSPRFLIPLGMVIGAAAVISPAVAFR